MKADRHLLPRPAGRRAQRGISLLFALMALVILGFGAVALTRSVDTGTLIMGNLSFKQDAMLASATAAEQAIVWLDTNKGGETLEKDDKNAGYYASAREALDPVGSRTSTANPLPMVDWEGDNCADRKSGTYSTCEISPASGTDVNGNKVKWVITRLCKQVGVAGGTNYCTRPATAATSTAVERGELQAGGRITRAIASPYYRVIVRVQGPRNTVSYTESLVHF
jgi:type IV pilus assembly protein PilX